MGRPRIKWDEIPYKDYPMNKLLGRERNLQRQIETRNNRIQKLRETIKDDITQINREIMMIKGDLSDVRKIITEKSKDVTNKGIYILRGDKWVRGKVRMMGTTKWVHVGSTSEWGKKSDDEILKKIKDKLGKSLTKPHDHWKKYRTPKK